MNLSCQWSNLFKRARKICRLSVVAGCSAAIFSNVASAAIVGPYTPDANTLHLWHLDETSVPVIDTAPGGTNLATLGGDAVLGAVSFGGFGTALDTTAGTGAYLSGLNLINGVGDEITMTYADATSGAFTIEAVVRVDFDPATFFRGNVPLYLVTGENETGSRPWQFRIHNNNVNGGPLRLEFFNIGGGGSVVANIPTTGDDAIVQGNWYHVAVTFSGAAAGGTLKLYWTLMDPSRVQANEIGSGTLGNLNPIATANFDFAIGNVGRTTPNGNWIGLIDEIRFSNIARSPTDMMFNSAAPLIVQDPVGSTNAVGQPVTFTVTAAGVEPLLYQWRRFGTNLPNATESSFEIASAQLSDSGDYDVVVTNASGSVTSSVATLLVRLPNTITWLGSVSGDWDDVTVNWDSNGDLVADTAYTPGDAVIFDNNGGVQPFLNLTGLLNPGSVTVNADFDYLFGSSTNGGITSNGGLTKRGAGMLTLDTDNFYSGPTVIEAGTLTVGSGAINGAAATRGSTGSGPITNLGTLRFDRVGTLAISSTIAGDGELVKDNTLNLQLLGTNTMSGPISINRGNVTVGPAALGSSTNLTLIGVGAGNGTSLTLRNGTVVDEDVTLSAFTSLPDNRVSILSEGGSNIFNGALVLDGAASVSLNSGSAYLEVNGPVTGPNYTDFLTLRGNGTNSVFRSVINLPNGVFQKTDGGSWIITSTGHTYLFTRMLGGTVILGTDNALATSGPLLSGGGVLDLAGFNQTLSGLSNFTSGSTIITNSSTTADSRLNVVTPDAWSFRGIIADSAGGPTRRVSFTLSGGGSVELTSASTYTGDTTITAGSLVLSDAGAISGSSPIQMSSGTTLDASLRSDGTFTVGPNQVLKGDGAFNVLGNLVNEGTIELKLGKSGAVLSNDRINGLTSITYGGTLQLNITATPALTTADSFKLFDAGSYSGAFASIVPAPGEGLGWDTSTLTTDGTLRIMSVVANPTNITAVVTGDGTQLELSWPASHLGWVLQVQTNDANSGISNNWFNIPGSGSTTQMIVPIDPNVGSVFYRMILP